MKRGVSISFLTVILSLAILFTAVAVPPAKAEEEVPTASMNVAFLSQYIWRGQAFTKDSLVIQPELTLGYYGFSFDIWGNLDTDQYDAAKGDGSGHSKYTETDLTLSYGRSFGPVNASIGYIYYALDGVDDTMEFYLSAGLDVLLAPTLTIYRDVDNAPGWYLKLGISHSFALTDCIGLDLGASVAYLISDDKSVYPDVSSDLVPKDSKYSGFLDGTFSVGLPIKVGKYFTIKPNAAISYAVGSDADNLLSYINQNTVGDDKSTWIYGGVTVTFAF